jgi:hypothetical protein
MIRFAKAAVLFTVLTIVMTWPQAARFTTDAWQHEDVFFNMWRLGWFAHALAKSPGHVLDGNIFYPEPRTLTYSDAMVVESVVAAPLLWTGVPPVLVHNLMLLGGIVLSAAGIFMLAAKLTGSQTAAITAGIVFAFVPYRFDHYMHLELQWTVWIPWAFWALHRTLETGAIRDAVLLGLFVTLQVMSSIYYGLFLVVLVAVCALFLLCGVRPGELRSRMTGLVVAGATAAVLIFPYAMPYVAARRSLGPRPEAQIVMFSARPSSYRTATVSNYLYGDRSMRMGRSERRLFPGVLPPLLAVVGLLLYAPPKQALMYLVGLAMAFEMSFGLKGYTFSFLYDHVPAFDGLRAPARAGIFVVFFLGVLAAYGHAALERFFGTRTQRALMALIPAVLLLEYWVAPLPLVSYPTAPPPLYQWLKTQPAGVVAEFPMPQPDELPAHDPRYEYMSTFHQMPLVNGYSGYYPESFLARVYRLRGMPDDAALQTLVAENVRYVIVHQGLYRPGTGDEVYWALKRHSRFREVGHFDDGLGGADVFTVR